MSAGAARPATGAAVLVRTKAGMAATRAGLHGPVVLVPTMGALHQGHRALLRLAREIAGAAGTVVVSVFVNPLQFGAGEDLGSYPRTLEQDLAVCAEEGAAVVLVPSPEEMYPSPPLVRIDPGPAGELLEGSSRPGFFAGVLTVVLKLFQLTRPDVAVFGQKDAQQLALVRRMTADLDLGVEIAAVPVVRDPDGLAISSRNAYLSPGERVTALALSRALAAGSAAASAGPAAVLGAARAVLDSAAGADPPLALDYLELVDPVTFTGVGDGYQGQALLLGAAWCGTTRLIDNAPVALDGKA
jgi:pantoate--beta-alanine ligase